MKAIKPESQTPAIPADLQLFVSSGAPGLDSARIAVLEGQKLTYYSGVAWASKLPDAVQSYLVDALRQSGVFASVSGDKDGVYAGLNLLVDVRDAQVESGAAHVRLDCKLVDGDTRKVLAAFSTHHSQPASSGTDGVVTAFAEAMRLAAQDILAGISQGYQRRE